MFFVPWLGKIFKSLEMPGGWKIEFQEVRRLEYEAQKAGLLKKDEQQIFDPTYLSLIKEDPSLALAGLRIEIERKLRAIAGKDSQSGPFQSLSRIVKDMESAELLTPIQRSTLMDILSTLNSAAHGRNIRPADAYEVMGLGQRLLSSLDQKLQKKVSGAESFQTTSKTEHR